MAINQSAKKVTLGVLAVFLISTSAFIALVIDHGNDNAGVFIVPSPVQPKGMSQDDGLSRCNGLQCATGLSQPPSLASYGDLELQVGDDVLPGAASPNTVLPDAASANTSSPGNDELELFSVRDSHERNAENDPTSDQGHGDSPSVIRRVSDALTLGGSNRIFNFNESVSQGVLIATGTKNGLTTTVTDSWPTATGSMTGTPSTSKLRFEQKLLKLGPLTGDPITYDRNNLPLDLVRLAPALFSGVPHQFLPEYKEPCWWRSYHDKRHSYLRCLPYFFIGGFPKCATTDLWGKLTKHPDIVPTLKEPHWWTRTTFSGKAVDSYLRQQTRVIQENEKQRRKDMINCDASALTFQDNQKLIQRMPPNLKTSLKYVNADILRAVLPDTKIVGIVRNPTDRAYSAYLYFDIKAPKSPKDFHMKMSAAIKEFYRCTDKKTLIECANTNISPHINTGCYSLYLREFLKRFPREQFYFLRTEDWSREPVHFMKEIYTFLGLDPMTDTERTRWASDGRRLNTAAQKTRVGSMLPETRRLLDDFYRPCNEDLAHIMGDDIYLWNT